MITSLAALAASVALLGASAVQSTAVAGQAGGLHATISVVAFDSDNGHGNNGDTNGDKGHKGNSDKNDKAKGHDKNKGNDENQNNEDESTFRGRHSSITGCVASFDRSRVFTLQTRSGFITVQPTGNALQEINSNNLRFGRILTAQGHFAGNGVYVAQQLRLGGMSSSGACRYAAQPFPTPGNHGVGNVVVSGTIQSVSGSTLRLSTSYGAQTVVFDANTLVDYANAPVGSGALRTGESVTVVGLRQTNGASIYARTIQIQSGIGQAAVVTGIVISASAGQFTVFSGMQPVTVDLTSQTVVQRGGARVDRSYIRPFTLVTVYGARSGNVVTASTVQL